MPRPKQRAGKKAPLSGLSAADCCLCKALLLSILSGISMKLYTRLHMLIAGIAGAALVAVFAASGYIFFFRPKIEDTQQPAVSADAAAEERISHEILVEQQLDPADEDSFTLQTSSAPFVAYPADFAASYTQDELQNITVYEKCNEAVVNINTQGFNINRFLQPVPYEGSGSGSVIDVRGYILTNTHVIANAYKIYVSLADGSQYEGEVIGSDTESDIAVIKINPPEGTVLKTIAFGDAGRLKVGQKVIAIGNPFGQERTLTTGVISGLGRPIQTSEDTIIRNMIQTDAAINPGNSGGPLLDTQGRMIGVNTLIMSDSGSSSGIGFAVPADTARRVVSDLIQYGTVRRGVIDARFIQLDQSIARSIGLDISEGLLVSEIGEDGPAAQAGLRAGNKAVRYGIGRNAPVIYLGGDIIVAMDGVKIATFAEYLSVLESKRPGDTVKVAVYRDRKITELSIVLGENE